ncbi:hypothetical protein FZEAL_7901 [Fusarium zealandicum]|uniref:Apple domain-containing protein n=1 Tax=Fusarium zealandicum TaxID=1053134 RepID=A0A8H4UF65_9HYPO|nr:hypothetical protein FZEAL_7901 [Fusarium zealandicum]
MLLTSLVGAVGLLATAVEAAPRGVGFNKIRRDSRGPNALRAQVAARSDSNSAGYDNVYDKPDAYTTTPDNYGPPDTYTKPAAHYDAPSRKSSISAINSKTLESSTECPTHAVYISTKTVDITVTVTASTNVSYTETCYECTKTLTMNNTVYVPPSKYASTPPSNVETKVVYPDTKTTTIGSEYGTALPYGPSNSTRLPPSNTKIVEEPGETESCTDEYPYMNSTVVPSYTAPIDKHASETQYPNGTAVYSTPGGYSSIPPVYTKPAHTKPVYSDPAHGNSTILPPVYSTPAYSGPGNSTIPPVYTKPAYTKPSYSDPASGNYTALPPAYTKPAGYDPVLPGNSTVPPVYTKPAQTTPGYSGPAVPNNSTIVPPVFTKPVESPIYTPPVYTKPAYSNPVLPGNSTVPPVYTKPAQTTPGYSGPAVPNNSTVVPPVFTKPAETPAYTPPIYTPPVYTKPAYTESVIPGNSSTVTPPVYTKPAFTKPVYSDPAGASNSSAVPPVYTKPVNTPIYTPPVYTKPVFTDPVVSGNSSIVLPIYTKPVETPVYTPPVYTKPAFPSESSAAANSTVPPVIPAPSSESTSVGDPSSTPVLSTSQDGADPISATRTPSGTGSVSTEALTETPTRSAIVSLPFLTATTTAKASTSETCIIDTSMAPISTSYVNATSTMPAMPTETVYGRNVENGATDKNCAYCGVNGKPAGSYFIAEFSEDRPGVAVTLEGCYQFCDSTMDTTRGCQAYRFYHNDLGAARCALHGRSVALSVRDLDSSVEDTWYDLTCGSPTEEAAYDDSTSNYRRKRSGAGAALRIALGF